MANPPWIWNSCSPWGIHNNTSPSCYYRHRWIPLCISNSSLLFSSSLFSIRSGAQTFYFTNEHWIYEFSQTLMSLDNPPLVTSLSWGWMEAQQCDDIVNSLCGQLGVDSRGITTSPTTTTCIIYTPISSEVVPIISLIFISLYYNNWIGYVARTNIELAKTAAMGLSVIGKYHHSRSFSNAYLSTCCPSHNYYVFYTINSVYSRWRSS